MARTSLRELLRSTPIFCSNQTRFLSSSSQSPPVSSPYKISLYDSSLVSLQACKNTKQLLQIQAQLIASGLFQDPLPASRILKFSADSGDINYTLLIFRQIESPDTFCANTVIKAYSHSPDPKFAVVFYFEMLQKGFKPNSFTFPPLVNSCAKIASVDDGEKCHGLVIKNGVDNVTHVRNSLVHMYASCGLVYCARLLFDEMPGRDLVSWNSMVDGYVKAGDLINARKVFYEMPEKNSVSWNIMIGGYLKGGNPGCALKLFREMGKLGVRGSVTTMVNAVTACGRSARVKEGRSVHGFWVKNFLGSNLIFETALVDMYSKCRRVVTAQRVFDGMEERNLVCWNAMIVGHCLHGCPEDGIALFEDMVRRGCEGEESNDDSQLKRRILPDEVTFIAILCACARAWLLSEGKKYFDEMTRVFNIKPNFAHYWCMANLYGGLGLVQEAEEVLKSIPEELESLVWSGLLGSCRFRGDVELGERIAKRLIELEPNNGSRYALLWNTYAVAGRWEDVAKVKEMMKERGLRITSGSSLIDLNKVVHKLKVGDKSQPEIEKIYTMMDELAGKLQLPKCSSGPSGFG